MILNIICLILIGLAAIGTLLYVTRKILGVQRSERGEFCPLCGSADHKAAHHVSEDEGQRW